MDFIELSDSEINEYAQSHGVAALTSINRQKRDVIKLLEKVKVSLEENDELLDARLNIESLEKIGGMLSLAEKKFANLRRLYGDGSTRYAVEVADKKNVIFNELENGMEIILPELLPHRMQIDARTQTVRFYYDKNRFNASYYDAFANYFSNRKISIYSEKVMIKYVFHLPDIKEVGVFDLDNYDIKGITDIIATFLLYDDDFRSCSITLESVLDSKVVDIDHAYTQIFVTKMLEGA